MKGSENSEKSEKQKSLESWESLEVRKPELGISAIFKLKLVSNYKKMLTPQNRGRFFKFVGQAELETVGVERGNSQFESYFPGWQYGRYAAERDIPEENIISYLTCGGREQTGFIEIAKKAVVGVFKDYPEYGK
jgi:hypothetical protein